MIEKNRSRRRLTRTAAAIGLSIAAVTTGGLALAGAAPVSHAALTSADTSVLVAISPTRVLDTRPGPGFIGAPAPGPLGQGQTLDLALTAPNGPLPVQANAAVMNITLDSDATAKSFITVWPTGEPRPTTSANNAEPGLVSPNSTIAKLGANGSVSIFNQQGRTNVIVDVVGYLVTLDQVSGIGSAGPQGPAGASGPQGPAGTPGAAGSQIYSGTLSPPPNDFGANGDYYFNTAAATVYGPKANNAWGGFISLRGGLIAAYNARATLTAVPLGSAPIVFTADVVQGGAASITSQASGTQFAISAPGFYRASYRVSPTTGSGEVGVTVNGTNNGPVLPVTTGASQTDEMLLELPTPVTIEVVLNTTGEPLAGSAQLMIEQVASI